MDNRINGIFENFGIKQTPNRILVLEEMLESTGPVSLADLETRLETVDKSNIFRTLNLFKDQGLVHSFEDGSGSVKYELTGLDPIGDDTHVHFFCESCHETHCLKIAIPEVPLPEGFRTQSINYTIKGLCPKCSAKR